MVVFCGFTSITKPAFLLARGRRCKRTDFHTRHSPPYYMHVSMSFSKFVPAHPLQFSSQESGAQSQRATAVDCWSSVPHHKQMPIVLHIELSVRTH
jgi:hypothetical protein